MKVSHDEQTLFKVSDALLSIGLKGEIVGLIINTLLNKGILFRENFPEEADVTPVPPKLPHSRACGPYNHEHGVGCHENCPTCGGTTIVL